MKASQHYIIPSVPAILTLSGRVSNFFSFHPISRFLVHWGVDINAADSDGWTPLHCAASCNSVQMVKFLVENGAQIFAETFSDNETGKIKVVKVEANGNLFSWRKMRGA